MRPLRTAYPPSSDSSENLTDIPAIWGLKRIQPCSEPSRNGGNASPALFKRMPGAPEEK